MKEKDKSFMCLGPVRSDSDWRREGKVKPKVAIIYLITDPSNVQEHTLVLLSPRRLIQTRPTASPFWPDSRSGIPTTGRGGRLIKYRRNKWSQTRERWSELEVWKASKGWWKLIQGGERPPPPRPPRAD